MKAGPTEPEGWWDVRRAADHADVSIWTVYDAVASGRLRHVRIGGLKAIRLKQSWVDAWLERPHGSKVG